MATLGELLFYIATQQHGGGASANAASSSAEGPIPNAAPHNGEPPPPSAWQIPASTVGTVTRMLRQGEDEIAQHYAVKTMENIASHGGEWASRFCGPETVSSLRHRARRATTAHLRGFRGEHARARVPRLPRPRSGRRWRSTASRRSPVCSATRVLARSRRRLPRVDSRRLADAGARDRASLGGPEDQLTRERVATALVAALDRGASAARGKSALVLAALFRVDHRWMLAACAGTKTLALLDPRARAGPRARRTSSSGACVAKLADVLACVAPKISGERRCARSRPSRRPTPGRARVWGRGEPCSPRPRSRGEPRRPGATVAPWTRGASRRCSRRGSNSSARRGRGGVVGRNGRSGRRRRVPPRGVRVGRPRRSPRRTRRRAGDDGVQDGLGVSPRRAVDDKRGRRRRSPGASIVSILAN